MASAPIPELSSFSVYQLAKRKPNMTQAVSLNFEIEGVEFDSNDFDAFCNCVEEAHRISREVEKLREAQDVVHEFWSLANAVSSIRDRHAQFISKLKQCDTMRHRTACFWPVGAGPMT
jgi:hypothetical protein